MICCRRTPKRQLKYRSSDPRSNAMPSRWPRNHLAPSQAVVGPAQAYATRSLLAGNIALASPSERCLGYFTILVYKHHIPSQRAIDVPGSEITAKIKILGFEPRVHVLGRIMTRSPGFQQESGLTWNMLPAPSEPRTSFRSV